jgi:hypothetical protein
MRVAFGLVGILVTLGVIVLIMKYFYIPSTQQAIAVQKQVEQSNFTGRSEDGTPVEDTYVLVPDENNGKLVDFQVAKLNPGSPMASHFGLQENDVILSATDGHGVEQKISQQTDEESARLAVREAYTTSGTLLVQRGDQTLTLPPTAVAQNKPAPAVPPQASNQPPQPAQAQAQQQPQQKKDDGGENDTMDILHQRLHALPTY